MTSVHRHNDEPVSLLVDFIDRLPQGKALDIAMGRGRNALFLASRGFEVEGLDRDELSVLACEQAAKAQGLQIEMNTCRDQLPGCGDGGGRHPVGNLAAS